VMKAYIREAVRNYLETEEGYVSICYPLAGLNKKSVSVTHLGVVEPRK